jgi:sulfatase modifying factor 1
MKSPAILCSLTAALLCAGATASALTMETVTVGDPGNPNDPLTGGLYGGVSYTYNIGKYEVTLNQYTEFLNAVADTDTYGLYNPDMGTSLNIKGITRSGSSGNYSYSVFGDGQRPVTYVSWFDAARFSNWLGNGQPAGLQSNGTTETGAYTLNGATSGVSVLNNGTGAYWIPSESEWYKAAYYQPVAEGGDADGYWLYPMQTNSVPYSDQPAGATPDNTRVGNFNKNDGLANGYDDGYAFSGSTSYHTSQQCLTPVGAYTLADSYYGTFDQGGNAWEWNDAVISSSRGLRGSGCYSDVDYLQSSTQFSYEPENEHVSFGFRIATVPEPTVSVSLMLAGGLLLARRKRPGAR